MRKRLKAGLSLGLASALIIPSAVSAAVVSPVDQIQSGEFKPVSGKLAGEHRLANKKFQDKKQEVSSDTLVIKYKDSLGKAIHQKAKVKVQKSLPSLGYDVVKLSKGQKMADVIKYYSSVKGVVSATPSVYLQTAATGDPKKNDSYHLSLLKIDEALKLAGNHEVTVAVIDTGIDAKHPELRSQLLAPYNVNEPGNQPIAEEHATHVSGIIAGVQGNGIGAHGINPKAKILPVDVFGGFWGASDYSVAEGILYAVDQGADVINLSLRTYYPSDLLKDAVQKALDAGVTIVAAAGNEATDEYAYPASFKGVIGVGATDSKNELSSFSNFGPSVDLVAPGEEIFSSIYDYAKGSSFANMSGTSMATPIVAGAASLLKSKYPDLKPSEIEAILKSTATDLGAKGYDLKYGNGLVNPTAALKFNMKNLPKTVTLSDEEMKKSAVLLKGEGKETQSGSFTQPNQKNWYKITLKKGEAVQTVLTGSADYDYGLEFDFTPAVPLKDKKASAKIEVNEVKAGDAEGYLFKAEEAGDLYIAAHDVNGNYSTTGKSTFKLETEKVTELPIDNSSVENMIKIPALRYSTDQDKDAPFTFLTDNNETDKDYFTFSVESPELIKLDVSGVPGVNSSIAVYFKEEFDANPPTDSSFEGGADPIAGADKNGAGKGESLVFQAVPGMEYVVEVSGAPDFRFFFDWFSFGLDLSTEGASSIIPYTLTLESANLPKDEDNYPVQPTLEEEYTAEELSIKEYQAAKKKQFKTADTVVEYNDEFRWFAKEDLDLIKENAVPYQIGKATKGHFQVQDDSDFYKFTAEGNDIVELNFDMPDTQFPMIYVYEYDEKADDMYPVLETGIFYGMDSGTSFDAALAIEKGKTYFVQLLDESGAITGSPYTVKSKKLMDVPVDQDIDQNEFIRAKVLKTGETVKNHLIYGNDIDIYYVKNTGAEKLSNLRITPEKLTAEKKQQLPEILRNDLWVAATVVEDTNGNLQLDDNEYGKAVTFGPDFYSTNTDLNATFKTKKNTAYFIVVESLQYGVTSVLPYTLTVNDAKAVDEDQGSVVKNNVPSKPLALKKGKSDFNATGYFNAGVAFGDKDYYKLDVSKNSSVTTILKTDTVLDGALKIFNANGLQVATIDYYGKGFDEHYTLDLAKGTYYLEVSEALGRTSNIPYQLTVQMK
ncbi:S8 family peptidase [Peribacillus loiseleuriae]|uniref:S8 family peptidase n=1 Tax=Peribacillus loiseleuriae TaxID=1679170 RepID=UPI003CFBFFFE